MKIALISHLYPTKLFPHYGKFIQDQFELLNQVSDVEIDLIVPTPYSFPFTKRWSRNHSSLICESNQSLRIRYLSFPNKRSPTLIRQSLSKQLGEYFKNKHYDLVHVHWLFPDGMALPHLNSFDFKTVLTVHGGDWYQNTEHKELSELARESLFSADQILCSGPKLEADILNVYPKLQSRSDVIRNTVDTDSYKILSDKNGIRKTLNWNRNKVHTLTVANIRHEKGVDLLVNTISQNEKLADVQFHIVGNPESTEFSEAVCKSIESNPFQNIDLVSAMSPSELIKYYQASDFYIMPSRREGFNVSALEAISCGLPLLCTDVGGNRELIDLGLGLLSTELATLDPSGILKMLDTYKNYDPEVLHQKIKEHFGSAVFTKTLLDTYNTVLNRD